MTSGLSGSPDESFGSYLRFLRRRARMTQSELSIAVGYSPGQISMLENGQRQPNITAVLALFIAALGLQNDTQAANRLVELAQAGATVALAPSLVVSNKIEWQQEEIGALEEMPPLPSCFVARPEVEERVAQWLRRERWAAICGLPGMGKSTLAAALAHSYATQYPILWLSFGHGLNQTPEELLRQMALFAVAYGSPANHSALLRRIAGGETPGPLRQQLFHVAGALHTLRSPLVVFDDAHLIVNNSTSASANTLTANPAEMVAILQGIRSQAPYCRLLFSTREELNLPGLPHLMLQGLAHGEALSLVKAMGMGSQRSGVEAQPTSIEAQPKNTEAQPKNIEAATVFNPIFERTAGNPLLLRLEVGQLEQSGKVAAGATGLSAANQLVMQVVEQLPSQARWLLDWLVVWGNVVDLADPNLAAWLALHADPQQTTSAPGRGYDHAAAVEQLRRKRIIDHDTHAFLHPLLREPLLAALNVQPAQRQAMHQLAATWAEAQGDRIKAAHHLVIVGDLGRACALLQPGDDAASASTTVGVAKSQVHAATAVIDEILAQLRRPLAGQISGQIAGQIAGQISGQNQEAAANQMIARLLALRGDLLINTLHAAEARANYRIAIDLTTEALARARLAQRLALSLLRIGHAQDALYLCEEALNSLAGNESGEATNLRLQLSGVLVRACIAVGRLDDATALCQEGIGAARRLRLTSPTVAEKISVSAYHGLGYICRRQANNEQARIYFERACAHARAAGLHNEEAESLTHLCVTLRELGDFAGAEQSGRRALEVAQTAGNDYLRANILHRLSIASYYHNELKVALERSAEAAALQRQMGDAGGMVLCDSLQAIVYTGTADLAEATIAINRARQESSLLDNDWLHGLVLYVYGIVHTLSGNLPAAETALREALQMDEYVRDRSLLEGVLIFLGINTVAQGNLEEARRIETLLAGNVAVEVELLGGLFRGMLAIAAGENAAAQAIATMIRRRAQESGYLIYAIEAKQLLVAAENPPPLEQLPAFVCLHSHLQTP